jgi:hypothetical protein
VRSGHAANYQIGKDTGRFWDAGAANVHWVIVRDDQVAQGISAALARVEAEGVIVEGNSFLEYVEADLAIMCARSEGGKIKPSARRALARSDLLYLSILEGTAADAKEEFERFRTGLSCPLDLVRRPIITHDDFRALLSGIVRLKARTGKLAGPPASRLSVRDAEDVKVSFNSKVLEFTV